jgi:uncharacterized protein
MKNTPNQLKNKFYRPIFLSLYLLISLQMGYAQQTIWKHSKGSFRQDNGYNWVEYSEAKRAWSFVKNNTSSYEATILYDKSRNCWVKLTQTACYVSFNGSPYTQYYAGGWSNYAGFDNEVGTSNPTVITVTPQKTEAEIKAQELENQKKQIEIAEMQRKRQEEINAQNERDRQAQIEKEAREREAREQKIAADLKRVKEEDKAVNGANSELKNALAGGNFEKVKNLVTIKKANPAAIYEKGENTLFFALNYPKILDFLIDKGAEVTQQREEDGSSPLHLVENLESAMVLVKYMRNLNLTNAANASPLERAIRNNRGEIAIYLIDKGSNVNSNDGMPLALACGMDDTPVQLEVARKLLSKGAKPNQSPPNKNGYRGYTYPLHLAASNDSYELVELLLEKGADPDLRDSVGKKAKSYAKNKDLKKRLKD